MSYEWVIYAYDALSDIVFNYIQQMVLFKILQGRTQRISQMSLLYKVRESHELGLWKVDKQMELL